MVHGDGGCGFAGVDARSRFWHWATRGGRPISDPSEPPTSETDQLRSARSAPAKGAGFAGIPDQSAIGCWPSRFHHDFPQQPTGATIAAVPKGNGISRRHELFSTQAPPTIANTSDDSLDAAAFDIRDSAVGELPMEGVVEQLMLCNIFFSIKFFLFFFSLDFSRVIVCFNLIIILV